MKTDSGDRRVAVGRHVTLYRRPGSDTWTADFHYIDKNGVRKHTRKSLKTRQRRIAEQRARELEGQIESGELQVRHHTPAKSIREVSQAFIAAKSADSRAEKTITQYTGETKLFADFLETLGVTRLTAVNPHHADLYKAHRKTVGQLDDYTVFNRMIVIKQFMGWAKSRGFITVNPFAEIRVPKPRRRKHPAGTMEQVNAILVKAGAEAVQWVTVFATLAFTGLRIGELVALRVEDVDLKEGIIRVRVRDGWRPKTAGSEREVPIHGRLAALLGKVTRPRGDYFFVAPPSTQYPLGGHHVNPREANVDFQTLASACGFAVGRDQRGLTLHALRRFFKTFCLDAGVPKPMVDYWTGHVDDRSMDFFYYDPQKSKQWMAKVPFGGADAQDPIQN